MKSETILKLKVFAVSTLLAGSLVLLPGCSSNKTLEDYTDEEIAQEYERRNLEEIEETGYQETRIFEPGEHIIKIEERELTTSNLGLTGSDKVGIICPEGYELVTVYAKGNSRNYYVFTNSVPVEVVADENGEFSSFGTPVTTEDLDMQNVTNKIKTR